MPWMKCTTQTRDLVSNTFKVGLVVRKKLKAGGIPVADPPIVADPMPVKMPATRKKSKASAAMLMPVADPPIAAAPMPVRMPATRKKSKALFVVAAPMPVADQEGETESDTDSVNRFFGD
jgi:hypothetical protein